MKNEKKLVIHYKNGKTRVITDELDYNITAHEYVIKMLQSMFKDSNPMCLLETKNDVIVILNKYDITEITVSKETDQLEITELITNKAEPIEIDEVNNIIDELSEEEKIEETIAKKETVKKKAENVSEESTNTSIKNTKANNLLPPDEFYDSNKEVPKPKPKKKRKSKKNKVQHLKPLDDETNKPPEIKRIEPHSFVKPIPLDMQVENVLKNASAEDGVFIDSIKKDQAPNIIEITKDE